MCKSSNVLAPGYSSTLSIFLLFLTVYFPLNQIHEWHIHQLFTMAPKAKQNKKPPTDPWHPMVCNANPESLPRTDFQPTLVQKDQSPLGRSIRAHPSNWTDWLKYTNCLHSPAHGLKANTQNRNTSLIYHLIFHLTWLSIINYPDSIPPIS